MGDEMCSVCFRRMGFSDGDDGSPPVDLGRCASAGGFECRAVGQAVAGYRRENEVLRSNCNDLSSENASLSSQVDSMAMRIESLTEELAKPEDVRLREVLDALDGRAAIFDSPAQRVSHLLDEMDVCFERSGIAERACNLLRRLTVGGSIVSSSGLSVNAIALARASDRMWVDADGYGYVYVPGPLEWRDGES